MVDFQISFTFQKEHGEAVYQIELSSVNSITSKNTSVPRFNASNLISGQTYNVIITVFGEGGGSDSKTHIFTTGKISSFRC